MVGVADGERPRNSTSCTQILERRRRRRAGRGQLDAWRRPPANDDFVYLGNLPGIQDSTVEFGPGGFAYGFLEISDGMTLDQAGGELMSFGEAWITGKNSRLTVRPTAGAKLL